MEYYGKGPLLTAKELDIAVAWERARQMKHACEEVTHPFPTSFSVLVISAKLQYMPAAMQAQFELRSLCRVARVADTKKLRECVCVCHKSPKLLRAALRCTACLTSHHSPDSVSEEFQIRVSQEQGYSSAGLLE